MTESPDCRLLGPCGPIAIGARVCAVSEVLARAGGLLQPERLARIRAVAAGRTFSVLPVLEGLYDRGNVSAVVRSAEGLGYGAVHVIETSQRYKQARRVTQGAEKWLDIHPWPDTRSCFDALQAQGYRILLTCFEDARPIAEVDFSVPTALVLGNEHAGVSAEAKTMADGRVHVPMQGFAQSFNISVAAAICLYHAQQDRIRRLGRHGDLAPEAQEALAALYVLRSSPHAAKVLLRELDGDGGDKAD